jgi:hypothetical protein
MQMVEGERTMSHRDAERIVLTAFLKDESEVRDRIASTLTPNQLFGWGWVYELMLQLIESKGYLKIEDLYAKTRDMVYSHLPAHLEVIEDAFAIELPDEEAVNDAMSLLVSDERRTTDAQDWAEKITLAAILKGSSEIRARLLVGNYSEYFEHFDRASLMKWAEELLRAKGIILKEDLIHRMEEYISTNIMASYTIRIDQLRETEIPNEASLTAAISWLEQHQRKG